MSLLKWHQVFLTESANYKKHLKNLITQRLPYVQFEKSLQKNEPESIILPTAVSKAMEIRCSMLDNDDKISQFRSTANMLRNEMMEHRNWSFNGSFEDFKNLPLLQFFLTHLLSEFCFHLISWEQIDGFWWNFVYAVMWLAHEMFLNLSCGPWLMLKFQFLEIMNGFW